MSPLDGVTIVDLTRVLSGPYCTMLLGDMGARVIKIEQPGRGDDTRAWGPPFVNGESAYFLSVNRNKESVTLDFKQAGGRAVLDELIGRADVLVENFRPGTLDRLGLGYGDLAPRCSRLIYCSVSGYGHTGPKRDRPGYDAVLQAEGGLMSLTGAEDGPPFRLGVAIADIASGMFAAQGILGALLSRERTGRGQFVDVAMLDAVAALLTYQAAIYFTTGVVPTRMGNRHPTIVPYETFDASDGEFVLAVGNDEQWGRFCEVTGLQALGADPRFRTNPGRVSNYHELRPSIARALASRPRRHWMAALTEAGVPCGSIRGLDEVLADPQLIARSMVATMSHPAVERLRLLGVPVVLSGTPGAIRLAPPLLGQHTRQVLSTDLGMPPAAIERLQAANII